MLGWTREARVACCAASEAPRSVLRLHAVVRVLLPRLLDHVAVVVDELALLALDEAAEEGAQDAVRREELHLGAVAGDAEDLRHEVARHLVGLRGEHTEGELAQLRRRVVEEQVGEHHARRERVHAHLARSLDVLVAGHTVRELLDEGVGELGQPALGRSVARVAGRAAALDARADRLEDVALDALLLLQHLDRRVRAQEQADEVDLDDGLDDVGGHLGEGAAAAVDAGVVDPVVHRAELLRREVGQPLHGGAVGHVALDAVDARGPVRVLRFQGRHRRLRVLDIADHHPVPLPHELVSIRPAHTASSTGNDHALRLRHGDGRRREPLLVRSRQQAVDEGAAGARHAGEQQQRCPG
mmetsp:Transcript_17128/g.42536  ORF Transcript_17128/g.42536 Transcript_17128/m.42536 type:complete len:356 (+) Transcript_17128:213-1280(+)